MKALWFILFSRGAHYVNAAQTPALSDQINTIIDREIRDSAPPAPRNHAVYGDRLDHCEKRRLNRNSNTYSALMLMLENKLLRSISRLGTEGR